MPKFVNQFYLPTFKEIIMIIGYAVIAVPTGIVSAEIVQQSKGKKPNLNTQSCIECGCDLHDDDAKFCKECGNKL